MIFMSTWFDLALKFTAIYPLLKEKLRNDVGRHLGPGTERLSVFARFPIAFSYFSNNNGVW